MSRMQFVSFQYFIILAYICGDKCLHNEKEDHRTYCDFFKLPWDSAQCQRQARGFSKSICQCGQQTMSIDELGNSRSYCCSPEWPCQDQGNKIVCQNGTLVSENDKCGNECPTGEGVSAMSIATKEACDKESKCYMNKDILYSVNEVCDHSQNDESDFAKTFCGFDASVPCFNNVTTGMYSRMGQCYNTYYIG